MKSRISEKDQALMHPAVSVGAADLVGLRLPGSRLSPIRLRPARARLLGAHKSGQRGRGMDYRESRHYQAGDDIRNMDWRITARAGRAHVKLFDEERERPVVILLDLAPSMFFGTRGCFKSVQAARLAALLGWAAIAHGDRIGALIVADDHRELSPAGGRRGQMRLIRALVEAADPAPLLTGRPVASTADAGSVRATRQSADQGAHLELSEALARLRRVARPGSLIVFLSDFYRLDLEGRAQLTRLAEHTELVGIEILDPLEIAPPPPGRYGFSDGRRAGWLDLGRREARERYRACFAERQAATQHAMRQAGVRLLRCTTDQDPAAMLAGALHPRQSAPVGLRTERTA